MPENLKAWSFNSGLFVFYGAAILLCVVAYLRPFGGPKTPNGRLGLLTPILCAVADEVRIAHRKAIRLTVKQQLSCRENYRA